MAYLTATILQQESAWWYTNWAPVITSTSAYTTWLGTIVTRAAQHVEWRVGSADYVTTDTLLRSILLEMELCLGQYYLALAAATIADSSDDAEQNPVSIHKGDQLRGDAHVYRDRFNELLDLWGQDVKKSTLRKPRAASTTGSNPTPAVIPPPDAPIDWEATQ